MPEYNIYAYNKGQAQYVVFLGGIRYLLFFVKIRINCCGNDINLSVFIAFMFNVARSFVT